MSFTNTPGDGKKAGLLGVPLGFGAGKVGSELGVRALRLATISGKRLIENIASLGYDVVDHGDVDVVNPSRIAHEAENPKYLEEMLAS
jgi:hypothetical protein